MIESANNARRDWDDLVKSAHFLREQGFAGVEIALVLGSGLGALAEKAVQRSIIDTEDIPCYPHSSVEGHHGRIILGDIGGVKCLVFQGRVHYYEGHSLLKVCAPVIVSKMLGCETVILTNASGAINGRFAAGTMMIIEDVISVFFPNPLTGLLKSEIRGGVYNESDLLYTPYEKAAVSAAGELGIELHKGVLGVSAGPAYETPAEVRMLRFAGADAASMSTAPEMIMAKYLGMKTLAIACLTNKAAGISETPLTHEEVQETAGIAGENFQRLIVKTIEKIGGLEACNK